MLDLQQKGVVPPGSIGSIELADDAVDTNHIKDAAINHAKTIASLNRHNMKDDNTLVAVTGTTEVAIKKFVFTKNTGRFNYEKIEFENSLWTSDALKEASMKIYIDLPDENLTFNASEERYEIVGEPMPTPGLTLSTTEIEEDLLTGEIDISELAVGKHTVHISIVNAVADGISYNELLWAYGVARDND